MKRIKNWFRDLVVEIVIQNISVGGHCGLCGKWVDKAIVPVYWKWTICDECSNTDEKFDNNAKRSKYIDYPKRNSGG